MIYNIKAYKNMINNVHVFYYQHEQGTTSFFISEEGFLIYDV